jgi:hypothetical protein
MAALCARHCGNRATTCANLLFQVLACTGIVATGGYMGTVVIGCSLERLLYLRVQTRIDAKKASWFCFAQVASPCMVGRRQLSIAFHTAGSFQQQPRPMCRIRRIARRHDFELSTVRLKRA